MQHRLIKFNTLLLICFITLIIVRSNAGKIAFFYCIAEVIPLADKISHFFLFGLLSFLLNLFFSFKKIKLIVQPILFGSFLIFLFAVIEEFSQVFIQFSTLDLFDLVPGLLGIITFSLFENRCFFIEKGKTINERD